MLYGFYVSVIWTACRFYVDVIWNCCGIHEDLWEFLGIAVRRVPRAREIRRNSSFGGPDKMRQKKWFVERPGASNFGSKIAPPRRPFLGTFGLPIPYLLSSRSPDFRLPSPWTRSSRPFETRRLFCSGIGSVVVPTGIFSARTLTMRASWSKPIMDTLLRDRTNRFSFA